MLGRKSRARPVGATATICRMIIGLGVVGSFVGQEPNNSVYLAPFTMPCGEPCGLIGKFFARLCIVIRRLVVFLNVPQNKK